MIRLDTVSREMAREIGINPSSERALRVLPNDPHAVKRTPDKEHRTRKTQARQQVADLRPVLPSKLDAEFDREKAEEGCKFDDRVHGDR